MTKVVMKIRILALINILLIVSCTEKNQFPEKISEQINHVDNPSKTAQKESNNSKILSLQNSIFQYAEKQPDFDLDNLITSWEIFKEQTNFSELTNRELREWTEITGFLLELTGKAFFAEELERLETGYSGLTLMIEPYVLTKNLDNIYINLFQNKEINYLHTLGGEVKIRQKTDYPHSGSIQVQFGMTERRYMELNVRIPGWAEGANVTVKKVKYFTAPGEYCKIAKKWKEGDIVEIEFPIEKKP